MAFDTANACLRIAAIYEEALAALSTPVILDAIPYMTHWQETFPFATVQLGATLAADQDDEGEDFDTYEITVVGRLYAAKLTDGVKGEFEPKLHLWIPQVMEYFNARERLQSAAYPARPNDLRYARLAECSGISIMQAPWAGEGVTALGAVFTHELSALRFVQQAYL